jgi:NitT/TauT family transport system ATP-binding protein
MQELLVGLWQRTPKTIIFITHDIDEAIFLSQRVYIMTARPGRIKQTLDVNLPYPRSLDVLTSVAFTAMKRAVLDSIKEEGLKALSLIEASA